MKIVTLGTGDKGGIDSVINNIESNLKQEFSFKRYITHLGKYKIQDIVLAVNGLLIVLFYSIFVKDSVFHLHMSYRGSFWRKYIYYRIASFFNKRVIIHLHGSEFKCFYEGQKPSVQRRVVELIHGADPFVVLSESWYQYIKKIAGKDCRNIRVIPNFAVVAPIPDRKNQTNHILFLGALIERKGIFDLLESLTTLPDVTLHVGGTGDNQRFKKMVNDLNLQRHIIYHGWVNAEQKAELFAQCQLLILPSYNEGLPVVILEAMASGLPVISTPVGGIPEVILPGETGFLVEPGNKLAISTMITRVLADPKLPVIAENARTLYYQSYDVCAVLPALREIYQ